MKVNMIVAVTRTLAIGRGGDMLYHIGGDLRHFKEVTMGRPVVMGRRTFESLPKGALPGRRNVIITRNASYHAAGAETVPSLAAALEALRDAGQVFVIGGGQIYAEAMPLADRLYITQIHSDEDGDTHFPAIDAECWTKVVESEDFTDPRSGVKYNFTEYIRN